MLLQNIISETIKLTMTCILDRKFACSCATREEDERSSPSKRHILLKQRQGGKIYIFLQICIKVHFLKIVESFSNTKIFSFDLHA